MDALGPADAGFWAKLRRRKVIQWGIAYIAGAWSVLQGLLYVGTLFAWPEHVQRMAFVALALALPIVLVIAWYHGDRGEQHVGVGELTVVSALFLLGGAVFWWYGQRLEVPIAPSAAPTEQSSASVVDPRPSIAVLPFQNRSSEEQDAFFVEGIHDDILTQLSRVSALKTISRTSVERFRGTRLPMKAIAEQLGVANVLEGGVQRAGDRVRVTVQLIEAASDAHLWAETYDRDLTAQDVFDIQTEIARAIANALRARLTESEKLRLETLPTASLPAWEAYQLGMGRKGQRTSEGLAEAERLFRRAIDLDDRFALAYVGLADTLKLQVDYAGGSVALLDEADGKVAKAEALDATLAEVWVSKGGIASSRGEAALAAEFLQRAVALNPNSATAHHWLSRALAITGHLQDATNHAEQAAQLDPLSMVVLTNLAGYLEYVARFEDAEQAYRRALEIDPASSVALAGLGSLRAYVFNQFQDALDLARRAAAADPASPRILGMLGGLLIDLGELERSRGVRDELTRRWPDNPTANEYSLYISAVLGDAMADGLAERFIAKEPNSWLASKVARNVDLARDDVAAARARYEVGFPELFGSSPRVDASNVSPAIDLALVLATQGDHEAAVRLLSASEDVISTQPRLGAGGYGLMDVQILAMRGERERALVALQQAVEDGWRGKAWRYFRDIEPNLASIRNTAKFKAAFDAVEQDLQRQRMR